VSLADLNIWFAFSHVTVYEIVGLNDLFSFTSSSSKVLKLQACKYLTDTSLEPLYKDGALPALQELDLSYGTLCQSAIEELLACCRHLTHLSLNGCVNMHDLNWGCSGGQLSELPGKFSSSALFSHENIVVPPEQPNRLLQNLNCVGCPNIRKVVIPPVALCLHLSSLNLSLSANLKEVDVVCFNLCFLNLRCASVCWCCLRFFHISFLYFSLSNICMFVCYSAIVAPWKYWSLSVQGWLVFFSRYVLFWLSMSSWIWSSSGLPLLYSRGKGKKIACL